MMSGKLQDPDAQIQSSSIISTQEPQSCRTVIWRIANGQESHDMFPAARAILVELSPPAKHLLACQRMLNNLLYNL